MKWIILQRGCPIPSSNPGYSLQALNYYYAKHLSPKWQSEWIIIVRQEYICYILIFFNYSHSKCRDFYLYGETKDLALSTKKLQKSKALCEAEVIVFIGIGQILFASFFLSTSLINTRLFGDNINNTTNNRVSALVSVNDCHFSFCVIMEAIIILLP